MPQGQLNHLTNLSELLAHATNIVIANILGFLFVITVDRITLVEECSLGGDDTVLGRVHVDNLELDGAESTTYNEGVALFDGAVAVLEVGDEVGLCDATCDTFNGIREGQHVNFGCIGDVIGTGVHGNDISHSHSQVSSYDLVHQDMLVFRICLFSDQSNADSLLSFLSCRKKSNTSYWLSHTKSLMNEWFSFYASKLSKIIQSANARGPH